MITKIQQASSPEVASQLLQEGWQIVAVTDTAYHLGWADGPGDDWTQHASEWLGMLDPKTIEAAVLNEVPDQNPTAGIIQYIRGLLNG